MKFYWLSLAAGLVVGIVYGLLQVRSPAPPLIALIGLLGILVGEQTVPIGKRLLAGEPVTIEWLREECLPAVLGKPPTNTPSTPADKH